MLKARIQLLNKTNMVRQGSVWGQGYMWWTGQAYTTHNMDAFYTCLCVFVCVYSQVDYAMDVFKQLYPDSPDPEGNGNGSYGAPQCKTCP